MELLLFSQTINEETSPLMSPLCYFPLYKIFKWYSAAGGYLYPPKCIRYFGKTEQETLLNRSTFPLFKTLDETPFFLIG